MNIGLFGTGIVGQTVGAKLVALGHNVMMGSREAGNEKSAAFVSANGSNASAGTFAEAAAFGEIIILATSGGGTLQAIEMAGQEHFAGKTVLDITNPLDFSNGMPPTLLVGNTDSLGEQVQRALPESHVVKALNTVNCQIMVDPTPIPGSPDMLICGNDQDAKNTVSDLLKSFGWDSIIDLGGIEAARTTEAFVILWVHVMQAMGTPHFGYKFIKATT